MMIRSDWGLSQQNQECESVFLLRLGMYVFPGWEPAHTEND